MTPDTPVTMLLCIGAFLFLVAACTVTDAEVTAAYEACKPHGGVKAIVQVADKGRFHVECNNGTSIVGKTNEGRK